jgi:hypothetical protein
MICIQPRFYAIITPTLLLSYIPATSSSPSVVLHISISHAPKINLTTTTPLGETKTITTQLTTLLALLIQLFLLIPNILHDILSESIAYTIVIALIFALTSTLDHLMYLFGISIGDKDETFTSVFSEFLFDMDILTAICIGIRLGPGYRDLGIEDFGIKSLYSIGLLLLVVVPKGFIEGKITRMLLKQGAELLQSWKGDRRREIAEGDVYSIAEKQEEASTRR